MRQTTPPDFDKELLLTAVRTVGAYFLTLLLCLAAAMLAGCRTNRQTAILTTQSSASAIRTLQHTDTVRRVEKTATTSVSTTMGKDSEQTHIHIERDPEGRPSDITVNKSATSGRNTATMASATTEGQLAVIGWESSETKVGSAAKTEELKPVDVKEASVAAKILAVFIAFTVIMAIGWWAQRSEK